MCCPCRWVGWLCFKFGECIGNVLVQKILGGLLFIAFTILFIGTETGRYVGHVSADAIADGVKTVYSTGSDGYFYAQTYLYTTTPAPTAPE